MVRIRPEILRRYHEAAFGGIPASPTVFEGVTFEEYVALRRIQFPRMSAWRAATEAPFAEFRRRADDLEPDRPGQPALPIYASIERKTTVQLRQALAAIDPGVERLVLDRLKSVSGWPALEGLRDLDDLQLVLCASDDREAAEPPIQLRRVGLTDCDAGCIKTVLRATSAQEIDIAYPRITAFDCALVRHHGNAATVSIHAPIVRHVDHLGGLPIRDLRIGRVEPDAALTRLFDSLAATLETLLIAGSRPLDPTVLPPLPHLTRLRVPGTPDTRQQWIDFAVSRPDIACFFPSHEPQRGRTSQVSLLEIYRGVDILRSVKGKRESYEIAMDLASEIPRFEGDNGDIEDELRQLARREKRRGLHWSSEADTLVALSANPDALRWVIDAARGLEG